MAFEWKELIKRFHYTQYDERKLIRDLQLQVDDLNAFFGKTADEFNSLDGRYYTEAETDSLLAGKADLAHDHDGRYYTKTEIDALIAGAGGSDPWSMQPVGAYVGIATEIAGVAAPPTDQSYRYVKLTASDSYNAGVLTDEATSGISPNLTATAVVSLAGSPINGQTISLINTDRRFLRAGNAGAKEQSQNLTHIHTGSTNTTGSHGHTGTTNTTGAHTHQMAAGAGATNGAAYGTAGLVPSYPTGSAGNHAHTLNIVANGDHSHTLSIAASGGDESRPANIGVTYFMRIK